jgi:hypothetical protein
MLSIFPEILFLAPVSAFLMRVALGVLFAYTAWHHISRTDILVRILGIIEIGIAATLITGSWTQAGSLVGAAVIALWLFVPKLHRWPMSTLLLALVMCASLLVTGAGSFAFDLPL